MDDSFFSQTAFDNRNPGISRPLRVNCQGGFYPITSLKDRYLSSKPYEKELKDKKLRKRLGRI
jgi:hypothetical protein